MIGTAIYRFSAVNQAKIHIKGPDHKIIRVLVIVAVFGGAVFKQLPLSFIAVKVFGKCLKHLIHTYMGDGNPLPCFSGEPPALPTCNDINDFARELWAALDESNRVALHARYIDLAKYPSMHTFTCDNFGGRSAGSVGYLTPTRQ